MNQALLLWGVLFGSLGMGFFLYGKQQKAAVPLICGLALIIAPYFVSNTMLLVGMGIILSIIPYFIRF